MKENKNTWDQDENLLGRKEARAFLNNMPNSTFDLNIKRGLIPKPRYIGITPLWRVRDLKSIYDNLPARPMGSAEFQEVVK